MMQHLCREVASSLARARVSIHQRRRPAVAERVEPRRLLVAIASDQTLAGDIGAVNEADTYEFTASVGQSVVAAVGEATPGSTLQPSIELIAPGGAVLVGANGPNGGVFARDGLAVGGEYQLRVRGLSSTTGAYAVTLALVVGPQSGGGDAGPTTTGLRKIAAAHPGDVDVHTISGTAGGAIFLALGDATAGSAGDPSVRLYAPSGVLLGTANANAAVAGANLTVATAATGTYYAVVFDGASDEATPYALTVTAVPGAQPTDADSGPFNSGERRAGVAELGDVDAYQISGVAGGSIGVFVGDAVAGATGDPAAQVYSPTGALLDTVAALGSVNASGAFVTNLAVAGTYTVLVHDFGGDEAADYALSLFSSAGAQATDADSAAVATGALRRGATDLGDVDVYTVALDAGQSIVATVGEVFGGAAFEPAMQIFAPTGASLQSATNAGGAAILRTQVTVSGTYVFAVYDSFGDEAGRYDFSIAVSGSGTPTPAPGDEGGALVSGARRYGKARPGDLDVYTAEVPANGALFVTLGETRSAASVPQLIVLAPGGAVLNNATGAFGELYGAANLAAGTYTVVVFEQNSDAPLDYAVTAVVAGTNLPQAADEEGGPLASGAIRAGATQSGDADVYTVAATAGTPFTVRMAETSGTGAYNPTLYVVRPDGAAATTNAGAAAATVTVAAPQTGTYVVVAYDGSADASGAYGLSLDNASTGADTLAPRLAEAEYLFNAPVPALRLSFTEDVSATFGLADFELRNTITNEVVDPAQLALTFAAVTNEVTFGFAGVPGGVLPDGNYRLSVPAANLADAAGNALAAPVAADFFVLAGDANRDRSVNFADLSALALAYGDDEYLFSEGNFDYSTDGAVGFSDLGIVAVRYGTGLPLPRAAAGRLGRVASEVLV